MTAKLQNTQKLLEGIALSDFKKISESAEELLELTKSEEWLMHKTPRYELYSNEFQRAARHLSRNQRRRTSTARRWRFST